MLWKTVSDPYSDDWKYSVAVGWESEQTVHETKRRRLRNSDSTGWWSSSARYDGARPWRLLYTRT